MRVIQISDEVYDKLKTYIVDPFEDTPDVVIRRLIEIADKARNRWSSWDPPVEGVAIEDVPVEDTWVEDTPQQAEAVEIPEVRSKPRHNWKQQAGPIL